MAHPGQPTKYSEEVIPKIDEYLEGEKTIPTREGFACFINVNDDTLVEWEKVHPEFSAAVKRITQIQKVDLVKGGLTQKFNPTMSIFLLKANHGMIETEKRILAGDKDNPLIPVPIMGSEKVKDVSEDNSNE
jgi:hypothetical protein